MSAIALAVAALWHPALAHAATPISAASDALVEGAAEPALPPAADSDAETDGANRGRTIIVSGRADKKVEEALKAVPGGTGFVDQADVLKGRVLTNEDVLAFQPGVLAQAAGGADGIKISVRGSAVNRGVNFFRTGILFTFDGLPVTGPGGTPYELFEPLGLKQTEILRGANGFDRGSSFLGGAINYVTQTGKDSAPLEARVEGGSYGYLKGQLSSGGQYGKFDYFVSATYSQRNGYQKQAAGDSFGLIGNIGIQLADNIETRFFARYRQTWNQTPGGLLISEIQNTPRVANPQNVARDAVRIQPGSKWFGNKTTFTISPRESLVIGFTYHDYPIDIRTQNIARWAYSDVSATLDYHRTDTLFGRDSQTIFGVLSVDHTKGWQKTYLRYAVDPGAGTFNAATGTYSGAVAPSGLPTGSLLRIANYDGADRNIHLSNTSEPVDGLKITLGAAALNIFRKTNVSYPAPTGSDTAKPYSRNGWEYTARGGFSYQISPDYEFHGNVSRSVEPPNDWSFLTTPPAFTSGPAKTLASQGFPLKDQTAWTAELGARGTTPILGTWDISAYRAWVKNESITVIVDFVNNLTAEGNASPTLHTGVEVGLQTPLWRAANPDTNISLRQSYTYSDFRFRHDAQWGRNQLASLPRHFYQGELAFNHASGAYLSGKVQASSSVPIDYANTFYARPYAIFGATIGYAPKDGPYSLFIDGHNLFNKGYAAAISPVFNAAGKDQRVAFPGDGISIVAGISVKLGR
ncbi:MAG: TonB-dependent receptor [Novosphingobium aromaticivorans]|nr:TonB-dependent receptor [Novosphingobium aromaticivorans]